MLINKKKKFQVFFDYRANALLQLFNNNAKTQRTNKVIDRIKKKKIIDYSTYHDLRVRACDGLFNTNPDELWQTDLRIDSTTVCKWIIVVCYTNYSLVSDKITVSLIDARARK